jgi:hypothetical protein
LDVQAVEETHGGIHCFPFRRQTMNGSCRRAHSALVMLENPLPKTIRLLLISKSFTFGDLDPCFCQRFFLFRVPTFTFGLLFYNLKVTFPSLFVGNLAFLGKNELQHFGIGDMLVRLNEKLKIPLSLLRLRSVHL